MKAFRKSEEGRSSRHRLLVQRCSLGQGAGFDSRQNGDRLRVRRFVAPHNHTSNLTGREADCQENSAEIQLIERVISEFCGDFSKLAPTGFAAGKMPAL